MGGEARSGAHSLSSYWPDLVAMAGGGFFMASEVHNQAAIRLVMFNDTSKTRLVCRNLCVHLPKAPGGQFYVVINEKKKKRMQ